MLALVYHFDLLTTARHPSFARSDNYFFQRHCDRPSVWPQSLHRQRKNQLK